MKNVENDEKIRKFTKNDEQRRKMSKIGLDRPWPGPWPGVWDHDQATARPWPGPWLGPWPIHGFGHGLWPMAIGQAEQLLNRLCIFS